ncbi:Protein kinase-like domain containing protein [Amanita muscaria]
MWGNLSHGSMLPCLGICFESHIATVSPSPENENLKDWRQSCDNPYASKIQPTLFEVAKAIQYVHSLGIVLHCSFDEDGVYLDSDNHAKVLFLGFSPNDMCEGQFDYDGIGRARSSTLEDNIRQLGKLFYRVLFNKRYNVASYQTRPVKPQIPDNVWQLIQRCCAKDPTKRPTIDQVVQEMESWISLGQFTLLSIQT